ncbi:MAG: nitrilase-related carbon-nitrogen hydrolase [Verrucomicrobiota bacterium]
MSARPALTLAAAAVVSFHLAYLSDFCPLLIGVFLYCLFRLANLPTSRQAYYFGLGVGLAAYSPHLVFFWKIFGPGAVALWYVVSFWPAVFLVVGRACLFRFGPVAWAGAAPFVWTGLEYFRSELYYLRFSWLNPGYAFSNSPGLHFMSGFGVYGIGFLLMAWAGFAGVFARLPKVTRLAYGIGLAAVSILPSAPAVSGGHPLATLNVTGVQLEGVPADVVKLALDGALKKYPQTDLFVLSEYSFFGPVPQVIRDWCKQHHTYLVAGGEDSISAKQYYNTAFVVGSDGAIVFRQAKSVPVQFTQDGLPAPTQRVWNSPWGKLGLGICYDAGYTRVTDELIRQGAQALIFPTMDSADWGRYEHQLHQRIAPMRAAEYGVPVFRLCSSGISQVAQPDGRVSKSAPFPGPDAVMEAQISLPARGRMPPDRLLARAAVGVTLLLVVRLYVDLFKRRQQPAPRPP